MVSCVQKLKARVTNLLVISYRDIAQDIGEVQLSKCYNVMGQVEDDKVVQVNIQSEIRPDFLPL